jgi:hypothetical protein
MEIDRSEKQQFEVNQIKEIKKNKKELRYFIKWKKYSSDINS